MVCMTNSRSSIKSIPSLQAQLDEKKRQIEEKLSTETIAVMQKEQKALIDSKIEEHSLKEGQEAIDFSLPDIDGKLIQLSELLKTNAVVLTFYRGAWCPFCNLTLRAYEGIRLEIEKLGAKLIAISPQTPDKSVLTTEKAELKFAVLSDIGNKVARQYKLVYSLSQERIDRSKANGFDLAEYNGDNNYELPMAATFVIDRNGIIKKAFVSADHTKRLEPSEIIKTLEYLKDNE
jgi:peroxiredoxin